MKRTIALIAGNARTASVLLTLCVLCLAGCSQGSGTAPTVSGAEALAESEVDAIAKTAKDGREFMRALKRKTREKDGLVIPAKTSRKVTNKDR